MEQGNNKKLKYDISVNFKRVITYLAKRTSGVDSNANPEDIKDIICSKWRFESSIWGAEPTNCPCGMAIVERCWLYNIDDNAHEFVGNVCIKRFGKDIESVIKVVETLKNGVVGTVTQVCCKHIHVKLKSKTSNLFKYRDQVARYFGASLFDDKEEIQIINPKNIAIHVDLTYRLSMTLAQGAILTLTSANPDAYAQELEEFVANEKNNCYSVQILKMNASQKLCPIDTRDLRYVYLYGLATKDIKEQIKAYWKGRRFEPDLGAWRIPFNPKYDSLLDVRTWVLDQQ